MDLPDVVVDRVRPLAGVAAVGALITGQRVALVAIVTVHGVALREGLVALRALVPPFRRRHLPQLHCDPLRNLRFLRLFSTCTRPKLCNQDHGLELIQP